MLFITYLPGVQVIVGISWRFMVTEVPGVPSSNDCFIQCANVTDRQTDKLIQHVWSRKHRQSYRHADPRRQRTQVAQDGLREYRLLASVRHDVFIPCDLDLCFDLLTSGSIHIPYIHTDSETNLTKKWDKAQRVASPATAKATVHFLHRFL